eukprot:TRINITY_DN1909_c0_g1_i11.p1 TRINITY_DN1909_c0_g1~~TRINITY_DN1909_c0_g1_i11.p1  ORF type:complete len:1193 (-),score=124.30 TRINITY_DN1909_c0_g1_i11:419-3631(-)
MLELQSSFNLTHTLVEECLIYSNHDQTDASRNLGRINQSCSSGSMSDIGSCDSTCPICLDDITIDQEVLVVQPCQHQYHTLCCQQMVKNYIVDMVSRTSSVCVLCPKCKAQEKLGFLTESQVGNLLGQESKEFEMFKQIRQEVLPKDIMYCPNPHCDRMIALFKPVHEGRGADTDKLKKHMVFTVECDCGTRFCSNCCKREHWPLSCDEWKLFKSMKTSLKEDEVLQTQLALFHSLNTGIEGGVTYPLSDFTDERQRASTPQQTHQQIVNRYFERIGQPVPPYLRRTFRLRDIDNMEQNPYLRRLRHLVMQNQGMIQPDDIFGQMGLLNDPWLQNPDQLYRYPLIRPPTPIHQPPSSQGLQTLAQDRQISQRTTTSRIPSCFKKRQEQQLVDETTSRKLVPLQTEEIKVSQNQQNRSKGENIISNSSNSNRSQQGRGLKCNSNVNPDVELVFKNSQNEIASSSSSTTTSKSWQTSYLLSMLNDSSNSSNRNRSEQGPNGELVSQNQKNDIASSSKTITTKSWQPSRLLSLLNNASNNKQSQSEQATSSKVDEDSNQLQETDRSLLADQYMDIMGRELNLFKDYELPITTGSFTTPQAVEVQQKEDKFQQWRLMCEEYRKKQMEMHARTSVAEPAAGPSLLPPVTEANKGDGSGSQNITSEESIAKYCKDCPNCFRPVYLYSGCDHVRCGSCHFTFCYRCRKPLSQHGKDGCKGEPNLPDKEELEKQYRKFLSLHGSQPQTENKDKWIEERLRREREMRTQFSDNRRMSRFIIPGDMQDQFVQMQDRIVQLQREQHRQQVEFLNELAEQISLRKLVLITRGLNIGIIQQPDIAEQYQNIWSSVQLYKTLCNLCNEQQRKNLQDYCCLLRDCCRLNASQCILSFFIKVGALQNESSSLDMAQGIFNLASFQLKCIEDITQKALTQISTINQALQKASYSLTKSQDQIEEDLEKQGVNQFFLNLPGCCFLIKSYLRNFVELMLQWTLQRHGMSKEEIPKGYPCFKSQNMALYYPQSETLRSLNNVINLSESKGRFKALLGDSSQLGQDVISQMNMDLSSDDDMLAQNGPVQLL